VRSAPHTRPRSSDQQARRPSEHGMTSAAASVTLREGDEIRRIASASMAGGSSTFTKSASNNHHLTIKTEVLCTHS